MKLTYQDLKIAIINMLHIFRKAEKQKNRRKKKMED